MQMHREQKRRKRFLLNHRRGVSPPAKTNCYAREAKRLPYKRWGMRAKKQKNQGSDCYLGFVLLILVKVIRSAADIALAAIGAFQKSLVFAKRMDDFLLGIKAVAAVRTDKGLGHKILKPLRISVSTPYIPKNAGNEEDQNNYS